MKMIKLLVSTAMVATSFSPLAMSPAYATIIPSATTEATEANQCAADLGANAGTLLHNGSHAFTTEVVETGQSDGPTTEVQGSRVETSGTRFGTGTITYSGLSIAGAPFRTGGSVNLFGDQVATNKNWSNSEYDFTADFSTTTTISYTCEVTQHTEVYHPAVHIPGHPVLGYYVVDPDAHGNEEAAQNSCNAFNAQAPVAPNYAAPGFWGDSPQGNCVFVKTDDAQAPVDTDEFWTEGPDVDRTDLDTTHTVDETNIAAGNGHEVNGGPFTQVGTWLAQKVVICISPSTGGTKGVPGAWRTQNGYGGGNLVGPAAGCNTPYFKIAPWGGGSQTSNGTYISVPGY